MMRMQPVTNKKILLYSVLLGIFVIVASFAYTRWAALHEIAAFNLTGDIVVSERLKLTSIPLARAKGYATIIDLRPDGEAPDQALAKDVERAVRENKMHFAYVPVPQGKIPEVAVAELGRVLANSPKPIILYCRSGRRAAHAWSLAEASRPGGLDADAILSAVKQSGQTTDDLSGTISARIAQRYMNKGVGI